MRQTLADKKPPNAIKTGKQTSKSDSKENSQKPNGSETTFQFADHRPATVAQHQLQKIANHHPRPLQLHQSKELLDKQSDTQAIQLQQWVTCSDPAYKKWDIPVDGLDWWYHIESKEMEFRILNYDAQNQYHKILKPVEGQQRSHDSWILFWKQNKWMDDVEEAVPEVQDEEQELQFTGDLEGKSYVELYEMLEENYTGVNVATKFLLKPESFEKKEYDNLHAVALALIAKGAKIAVKQDVVLNFGEGTEYDEDELRDALRPLYENGGKPKKTQLLNAIRGLYHEDDIDDIVQSSAFIYGFQKIVREMIASQGDEEDFLGKTGIEDLAHTEEDMEGKGTYAMANISKWTLRHYSAKGTDADPPPFNTIKSAVALGVKDTSRDTSGGHTGQVDWRKYGNVGNTFYLLYIDGKVVQKQKFLDNAKWYCEFNLADIPSLWVSSDWLDEAHIKGDAFRGSGKSIQEKLLQLGGKGNAESVIATLSGLYHNFEVKVPGSLDVKAWNKA